MEPTASSENGRQSRGLARFWPVHGMPVPAQRQSPEDEATPAESRPSAVGPGTDPTGEQQLHDPRSIQATSPAPRYDGPTPAGQPAPAEQPPGGQGPRGQTPSGEGSGGPRPVDGGRRFAGHDGLPPEFLPVQQYDVAARPDPAPQRYPAPAGDPQMVALGSRRGGFEPPRTGDQPPPNNVTALRSWTGNQAGYAGGDGDRPSAGRNGDTVGGPGTNTLPHTAGTGTPVSGPAGRVSPTGSPGSAGPASDGPGSDAVGPDRPGPGAAGPDAPGASGPAPVSPLTNAPLIQPTSGRPTSGRTPGGESVLPPLPEAAADASRGSAAMPPAVERPNGTPRAPGRADEGSGRDDERPAAEAVTPFGSGHDAGWAQRSATAATPIPYARAGEPGRNDRDPRDADRTDQARTDHGGTDLARTDLARTDLSRTDLAGTEHGRGVVAGADAAGADAAGADAAGADAAGADAAGADAAGAAPAGASAAAFGEPAAGRAEARWAGTVSGTATVSGAGRRNRAEHETPGIAQPRRSDQVAHVYDAAGRRAAGGARTAEPAQRPGDAPRRPGDVEQTRITLWDDEATRQFHDEWHELKAQFVDDPVTALTRAHDLLTEAVHELTEALLAERDDLDPLRTSATPDTESMRMAMRGYREFLDRILAL